MHVYIVVRVLSFIGAIVSASMFVPAAWAWYVKSPDLYALLLSACCSLVFCWLVFSVTTLRKKRYTYSQNDLRVSEACVIVCLSWVTASVIGALPYLLSGAVSTFTDAFFESISGFTTTGGTILPDIEAIPQGILFWRALTHWLGGMGIVVLGLAILPFIGVGGMELYKAEVPTPVPEKLTPRLHQTAVLLWGLYVLLTVLQTVALMACGLSFFDSLTHAFSTIATGGFSLYNDSIAHYNSAAVEWVITFFMFLSGVNFTLHYFFLRGRFSAYARDDEFRWYLFIIVVAALAMTCYAVFVDMKFTWNETFRHSCFQVVSIITTTGFTTVNTLIWPTFCQSILLLLMFVGGCAGSTGGGIKVLRITLLFRSVKAEILRTIQPHRVLCVRLNDKPLKNSMISSVQAFFVQYILIYGLLVLLMTMMGVDLVSSISGVLTCLSNVGPGLGIFDDNYCALNSAGKWMLSLAMLMGRLELTTVLMFFMRTTWR